VCAKPSRSKRAMLFGIVSTNSTMLMDVIVELDLSLERSRPHHLRICAADYDTRVPNVGR